MLEPQRTLDPHSVSERHQQDIAEDRYNQRNGKGLHCDLTFHDFIRAWFRLILEKKASASRPKELAGLDYRLHKPMQSEDENKRNGEEEEGPWERLTPKERHRTGNCRREQKRKEDRCEKSHALFLRSNVEMTGGQ
jgi:hypothetical protein